MVPNIEERHVWWFRELYSVLNAFADAAENTISIIGGGRISVPEDQACHLFQFRRLVITAYPPAANLEIMRVVTKIQGILDQKSRGGASFEKEFWSNEAFEHHPDWLKIRQIARSFLLR